MNRQFIGKGFSLLKQGLGVAPAATPRLDVPAPPPPAELSSLTSRSASGYESGAPLLIFFSPLARIIFRLWRSVTTLMSHDAPEIVAGSV